MPENRHLRFLLRLLYAALALAGLWLALEIEGVLRCEILAG